jgi:uncharacterized protein YjbJ (UPF0337 family)
MAGLKERLAGRYMEWEGKATGDPIRRTEGKLVVAFGRLKQAVGKIRRRRATRGWGAGGTQPESRRPTGH